jgi:cytochrome c biogenesis protein CcmG, thiol:disulfide interchange protein DsbE
VKLDTILRAAIGVLLTGLVFVIYTTIHETVIGVGDTAPEFTVTTDQGQRITPTSFGGRLLVLNFWATWCPPCIEEMPSLDRFSRELAPSGVVVLGVSVDKDEKVYREFVTRSRIGFQTFRDPESRINEDYGTFKYPETYVISATGTVLRKYVGPETWDTERMLNDIRSLL